MCLREWAEAGQTPALAEKCTEGRTDRLVGGLKVVKDALEGEGNGVGRVVFCWDLVHGLHNEQRRKRKTWSAPCVRARRPQARSCSDGERTLRKLLVRKSDWRSEFM